MFKKFMINETMNFCTITMGAFIIFIELPIIVLLEHLSVIDLTTYFGFRKIIAFLLIYNAVAWIVYTYLKLECFPYNFLIKYIQRNK